MALWETHPFIAAFVTVTVSAVVFSPCLLLWAEYKQWRKKRRKHA